MAVERPTNRILTALRAAEWRRLAPALEPHELRFGQELVPAGETFARVYFPLSGVISVTMQAAGGHSLGVRMVGREGMVGLGGFLQTSAGSWSVIVQLGGKALTMPSDVFAQRVVELEGLRTLVTQEAGAALATVGQVAVCNRFHPVEQRLARWLLMMRDRADGDVFPITQGFLADMVGAHRPAVSLAIRTLTETDLIAYRRGKVTICDRVGLEAAACECYAAINAMTSFQPGG